MIAQRKVILNSTDIALAHQFNINNQAEYANSYLPAPKVDIPEPKYSTHTFNFKVHMVNSFYIERDPKTGNENGDIIVNLLYDGVIRLEYDPILESKLGLFLNGE